VAGGAAVTLSFLIAGVQKAGTTALYDHLRAHPALEAPAQKELHFFDDEARDWSQPDYAALHGHFSDPARRWFEATPITLFWPGALARVRAYRPEMRLILLFRDPIARAYSQWCMESARGDERLPFAAAIGPGRARLPPGAPRAPAWRVFSYVERGFYGAQLDTALALFPRRQMLLLDAAGLASEPVPTLRRVTDFLGLAPLAAVADLRANVRLPAAFPSAPDTDSVTHLRALYRDDLALFTALSGIDVSAWPTMSGLGSSTA
jgi:hypothetical protein